MKKTKSTSGQNKTLVGAAAVLAAALLLGGTYAWQSINTSAKGERETYVNPGGRLHYDLSGWEETPYNGGVVTEDIYVENFGNTPIVARVRLDEFMEIGSGAGLMPDEEGYYTKAARALPSLAEVTDAFGRVQTEAHTPDISDESGWWTHIPDSVAGSSPGAEAYNQDLEAAENNPHTYWTWVMGGEDTENNPTGQTVYMPTFNKNKDSLAPDINGSMDANGATVRYSDWVNYQEGDTATRVRDSAKNPDGSFVVPDGSFWDADDNTIDEGNRQGYGNGGVEGLNYTILTEQPHVAKKTEAGGVCTMDAWTNTMTDNMKAAHGYWVYDTDGWAYWSRPIYPNTATGVLLDKVTATEELSRLSDQWYYAINAVGQFITLDDLGRGDLTGFFTQPQSESGYDGRPSSEIISLTDQPTLEAKALLESIGVDWTVKGVMTAHTADATQDEVTFVEGANTYTLKVNFNVGGALRDDFGSLELMGDGSYGTTWTLTREGADSATTTTDVTAITLEDGAHLAVQSDNGRDGVVADLTVPADIPEGTRYRIEAYNSTVDTSASISLPVRSMNTVLREMAGSDRTIQMKGSEWYVLTINSDVRSADNLDVSHTAALMLSKDAWELSKFSGDGSTGLDNGTDHINLYNALNTGTIDTTHMLNAETTQGSGIGAWYFLLSEADLFGTTNGQPAAPTDYTTLNGPHKPLTAPGGSWAATYEKEVEDPELPGVYTYETTPTAWWTRTASSTEGYVRVASADGTADGILATKTAGVRPAFWYDMGENEDLIEVTYNGAALDNYTAHTATTNGTSFMLTWTNSTGSERYEVESSDKDKFTAYTASDLNGNPLVTVTAAEGVTDQDWADITVKCYTSSTGGWSMSGSSKVLMAERTFVVRGSPYTLALRTGDSYSFSSGKPFYQTVTAALTCAGGYTATGGTWTAEIGNTDIADWQSEPTSSVDNLTFEGDIMPLENYEGTNTTDITITFAPADTTEPPVAVKATVEVYVPPAG